MNIKRAKYRACMKKAKKSDEYCPNEKAREAKTVKNLGKNVKKYREKTQALLNEYLHCHIQVSNA